MSSHHSTSYLAKSLSPHTRGNPPAIVTQVALWGSIPAHTGKPLLGSMATGFLKGIIYKSKRQI